jgi:hypothetical protein
LEADPDRFWHGPGELIDFRVTIAAPPIDAAPIKRLGSPKLWHGKQDFALLLTGAYQAISQAASRVKPRLDRMSGALAIPCTRTHAW